VNVREDTVVDEEGGRYRLKEARALPRRAEPPCQTVCCLRSGSHSFFDPIKEPVVIHVGDFGYTVPVSVLQLVQLDVHDLGLLRWGEDTGVIFQAPPTADDTFVGPA